MLYIYNGATAYLYLKNLQGDVTALVSDSGEIVMTYTYDAWGAVSYSVSSMQNMQLAASLYNVNPFTYRGYCYDDDIGMYYLQSRYYDPQICRFINADSTDYLGATGTVLSYNLFAYCENDPVNNCDCYGYSSKLSKLYDWAGKEILNHWLYGNGKTKICDNAKWAKYMMANYYLKLYVKNHLLTKYRNYNGEGKWIYDRIHMEIDNGEGIIGYQFLHGTNAAAGDFEIWGYIKKTNNKITFNLLYIWNDIIDVNKKYPTDVIKSVFGKIISFGKAKDYYIHILWSDCSVLKKVGNQLKWEKGWMK